MQNSIDDLRIAVEDISNRISDLFKVLDPVLKIEQPQTAVSAFATLKQCPPTELLPSPLNSRICDIKFLLGEQIARLELLIKKVDL